MVIPKNYITPYHMEMLVNTKIPNMCPVQILIVQDSIHLIFENEGSDRELSLDQIEITSGRLFTLMTQLDAMIDQLEMHLLPIEGLNLCPKRIRIMRDEKFSFNYSLVMPSKECRLQLISLLENMGACVTQEAMEAYRYLMASLHGERDIKRGLRAFLR